MMMPKAVSKTWTPSQRAKVGVGVGSSFPGKFSSHILVFIPASIFDIPILTSDCKRQEAEVWSSAEFDWRNDGPSHRILNHQCCWNCLFSHQTFSERHFSLHWNKAIKLAHIKVEEIHIKYDIRYLHKYPAHIPTKNLDKLDQMLHKTKHGDQPILCVPIQRSGYFSWHFPSREDSCCGRKGLLLRVYLWSRTPGCDPCASH